MAVTQGASLPYGLRDVKLTPYSDVAGTVLGSVILDLPNAQTFTFSEAESFDVLRGDDKAVTMHGQGSTVEWELDSGGLSMPVWAALSGGVATESGTTPNRVTTMRKSATTNRPWFLVEGQAISDSGGDMHCIVWRARATDNITGSLEDGKFWITGLKGTGLPLADDVLYDFIENETVTAISGTALTLP